MIDPAEEQGLFQYKRASSLDFNHFEVCGTVFTLPRRYTPLRAVGRGAYGVVCAALDHEQDRGDRCAIKKISTDQTTGADVIDPSRIWRELRLLQRLSHENIVTLREILPQGSSPADDGVYVVFDLLDTDLHQIIRSSQPLTDAHLQYFLYQMLRGVAYLHAEEVVHQDLKPSNMLVNSNCDLQICDFGLATTLGEEEGMPEYMVTRWYRAPELLLSCSTYTSAIDIWSVGCIFAELLGRRPLFPGRDYLHQLDLILQVTGTPDEAELNGASCKVQLYFKSRTSLCGCNLQRLFPHANPQGLDLLGQMLAFRPSDRITAGAALRHPYLAGLHAAEQNLSGA